MGTFSFETCCSTIQTHRQNCFPGISSWLSQRYLQFTMFKIELTFYFPLSSSFPSLLYLSEQHSHSFCLQMGDLAVPYPLCLTYHQVPHLSHPSCPLHLPLHCPPFPLLPLSISWTFCRVFPTGSPPSALTLHFIPVFYRKSCKRVIFWIHMLAVITIFFKPFH